METMHGWMTGDPTSIAVWEHLPSGLRCQLMLQDAAGEPVSLTSWEAVEDFVPDDAGHALAHLLVQAGDARVEIECGGDGALGACRILDVQGPGIEAHWEIENLPDGWNIHTLERDVVIAPDSMTLPTDVPQFLAAQREALLRSTPQGLGELQLPLTAAEATVAANTVRLPSSNELITLSRHEMEGTYLWRIGNWETFLTALGIAYLDPALAIENCRTALHHLNTGMHLATADTSEGPQFDESHPPVASFALWKIYQLTGNDELLDEAFPVLLRWHDWWRNFRDGNHDRLLNWASAQETGMSGHPLYEQARVDGQTSVMRLDDVGLTSLWALDAFSLMRMALQRNDLDQATRLERDLNDLTRRVNLTLWEPSQGTYMSHDWHGEPVRISSATTLLALTGGIPSRRRAARMIQDHLLTEFNTPFMVPTVGRHDAAFARQLPWNGRVSPLLNLLIGEGLRRYGEDTVAEQLALSGLHLLQGSWQDHHQAFASYHALTGQGNDIAQDALSPISVLLSALGIGLLIDVEPWGGLRLGNLHGFDLGVTGLHILGRQYDITSTASGLVARRDGEEWLTTDRPAILRNLLQSDGEISLQVKSADPTTPLTLEFKGYTPDRPVSVKVNGVAERIFADSQGVVTRRVQLPPAHGGMEGTTTQRAA